MIKSIKVLLCGKNVIYCHFFDKITQIPSGRIVVPSGRIAVPLMGGFLVLEGKGTPVLGTDVASPLGHEKHIFL